MRTTLRCATTPPMSVETGLALLVAVLVIALVIPVALGLDLLRSRHNPERCRCVASVDAAGHFRLEVPADVGREIYVRLEVEDLDDGPDVVVHARVESSAGAAVCARRLRPQSSLASARASTVVSSFVATSGVRTSFLLTTLPPGVGVVHGRVEAAPGVSVGRAWVYAPA